MNYALRLVLVLSAAVICLTIAFLARVFSVDAQQEWFHYPDHY